MVLRQICESMRRLAVIYVFVLFFLAAAPAKHLVVHAAEASLSKEERKAFDALRKAIESQPGGYVHPALGLVAPAPSGAPRGLGIVSNTKAKAKVDVGDDVLLKVPLSYQMTRNLALSTLTPLVPGEVLYRLPLTELDDAALLVLLLAHERGLGKKSKFAAYVRSLPQTTETAGCGWAGEGAEDHRKLPPYVEPEELDHSIRYAHRVSTGMAGDYGQYLAQSAWPKEWKKDPSEALRWALCTVSSRGTVANSIAGANGGGTGTRLVPLADLANHFHASGGFTELSGKERRSDERGFIDATESDAGTFVVRAVWKCGTARELAKGDEVTVNYNLPGYGPADWYLSLGFIPQDALSKRPLQNNEL